MLNTMQDRTPIGFEWYIIENNDRQSLARQLGPGKREDAMDVEGHENWEHCSTGSSEGAVAHFGNLLLLAQ